MLSNVEIRKLLRRGQMKKFAEFIGMTPEGLRVRLNNNDIKLNLSGQYIYFLKNIAGDL